MVIGGRTLNCATRRSIPIDDRVNDNSMRFGVYHAVANVGNVTMAAFDIRVFLLNHCVFAQHIIQFNYSVLIERVNKVI